MAKIIIGNRVVEVGEYDESDNPSNGWRCPEPGDGLAEEQYDEDGNCRQCGGGPASGQLCLCSGGE